MRNENDIKGFQARASGDGKMLAKSKNKNLEKRIVFC